MPASRRVSLKDREERELNVRRALGAFITQPGEAQAAAGADTEEASVSKGTDVSFVTDDIWDTDYKGVTDAAQPSLPTAETGAGAAEAVPSAQGGAQAAALAFMEQGEGRAGRAKASRRDTRVTKATSVTSVTDLSGEPEAPAPRVRATDLPASFMLKGRRFDPPAGARKRQNYALSSETIKRIALASAHAGVGKAELVDAVLCAALRDILGDE